MTGTASSFTGIDLRVGIERTSIEQTTEQQKPGKWSFAVSVAGGVCGVEVNSGEAVFLSRVALGDCHGANSGSKAVAEKSLVAELRFGRLVMKGLQQ